MSGDRETVLLRRPVRVERVPDGTPLELASGTWAQVTQALGSSFTLVADGQLVRLQGRDADAIGREPPKAPVIPVDVAVDDIRDLVWQTLKNLVLRAVQAPFNFIGGLVSGGAEIDMSQVPFSAGSSELDKGAQGTLNTLAEALNERPGLRLEVEGTSAVDSDGPLLAVQRLQSEYQSTWYKMEQRSGAQVPATPAEIEVPEDEKPVMLEGIYRARLKQQPPAEWAELDSEVRADKMRDAVLASWGSSDLLLRKLAQARASSVKEYLVKNGGLNDQRVYLLDVTTLPTSDGEQVPTALHLDAE